MTNRDIAQIIAEIDTDHDTKALLEQVINTLTNGDIDVTTPIHYCSSCDCDYNEHPIWLPQLLRLGQALRKYLGIDNKTIGGFGI